MRVRAATTADAAGIARLHADGDLLTVHQDVLDPKAWARLQSEKRALWEGLLAEPPAGQRALVIDDLQILGFTSAGPDFNTDGEGTVFALFVDRGARGAGLGSHLLNAAERYLQDQYRNAGLWVVEDNLRDRRFYERRGWHHAEAVKHQQGVRFIRYSKRLPAEPYDLDSSDA